MSTININNNSLSLSQDVSDRVEKDQFDSPVLIALENCGECVVRKNWNMHIDDEIASDLRKYRNYHGESVRDLLRALRNKVRDTCTNMSKVA